MFQMREAVHISGQQQLLMREAVKHFTPTSVPDARSCHTFRANILPSTFSTSRELTYPWTAKKTHLLHLLHQHLLSSTILLSCCACVYSFFVLRFFRNVVRVSDHLYSENTVIFLNFQLKLYRFSIQNFLVTSLFKHNIFFRKTKFNISVN